MPLDQATLHMIRHISAFQKLIGCFFISLTLFIPVNAQDSARGGLRGTVKDADFFVPVAGANLSLEPGGMSASSDAEGRFFINDLAPGVYRLTIQAEGFVRTSSSGIVIKSGSVSDTDIELTA